MSEPDILVPADLRVVQNTRAIRLGVMEAAPTEPARGAPDGTTDGYSFRLVPLANAYLIGTWPTDPPPRTGDDVTDFILDCMPPYFVGRTNEAGHVLLCRLPGGRRQSLLEQNPSVYDDVPAIRVRELPSIHQSGPIWWEAYSEDAGDPMVLAQLDVGLGVFWTYHRDVFDAVIADLDDDHARAYRTHGFTVLDPTPRERPEPLNLPRIHADGNGSIADLLLTGGAAGYFPGPTPISSHNAMRSSYLRSGVVFDVTPPAFRAVYTAEWASRYATHIRKSTLEDWVKLTRMMNIISAYKRGEKINELEDALASSFVVNRASAGTGSLMHPGGSSTFPTVNPTAPALAEDFRVYAWKCARAGVLRERFARSIHFDPSDLQWRAAATEIQRSHREVRHPIDPSSFQSGPRLSSSGQTALLDYFDMYAFARARSAPNVRLDERVHTHARGIMEALGWVRTQCDRILTRGCRIDAFHRSLNAHVPVGESSLEEARFAMIDRHAAAAQFSAHAFWEGDPDPSTHDAQWATILFHAAWVKEVPSKAGKYIGRFLGDAIKAYEQRLADVGEANRFLNYMYRYYLAVEGQVASTLINRGSLRIREGVDFRIDFSRNTIDVVRPDGTGSWLSFNYALVEMPAEEIGTAVARPRQFPPPRAQGVGSPGPIPLPGQGGQSWYRAAADRGVVREFTVEVPADPQFRWAQGVPTVLTSFANVLSVARVIDKIRESHEPQGVRTLADLGNGIAGLVSSADAIIHAWRRFNGIDLQDARAVRYVEQYGQTVRLVGRVASVLGSGMDLVDGAMLMQGDDPNLQAALRRGDMVTANIMTAKGYVQFTAGIVGGVELAATVAGAAIAGPLGLVVFGLGVAVACADLAIWSLQDDRLVAQFIDEALAAEEREFLYPVGGNHYARASSRAGSTCRTRAMIATMNDTMRTRSPFPA